MKYLYCVARNGLVPVRKYEIEKETPKTYILNSIYTHIGGAPTRLQSSTRYIDYNEFDYITPNESVTEPSVFMTDEQVNIYKNAMLHTSQTAKLLEESGMPREDIALLLPLGMTTNIVDKRNVRNVIDMSRQRMCNGDLI